ncbi:hypothetical protein BDD12DRAFT_875180 [Trichophaea hybrida]|nr:hypothetical protein BDD12DRAFT_875180 [Trichophaea hybrida]
MILDIVPTAPLGRSPTVNTTTRAPAPYRYPPFSLLLTDTVLSFRNFRYLYTIVWPLYTTNQRGELYFFSKGNIFTIAVHVGYIIVGLAGFLLVPLWIQIPGGLWLVIAVVYAAVVWAFAWVLNRTPEGAVIESVPELKEAAGEKWVFVNGVMAGRWWVQTGVDEISRRFGRPVDAIHNHTFGLVLDLIQCLIQRDLGLTSGCVKETYKHLRTHLLQRDPINKDKWRYKKVIVIAHSQGGLITSLALDMLFADLADDVLSRLEIYTFGNAANHFNNPPNAYTPVSGGETIRFPTIKYIEHFANEFDFVSRLGVLAYHPGPVNKSNSWGAKFLEWSISGKPHIQEGAYYNTGMHDNQFAGKLFMRPGKGGHQFVMHYLDEMFKDGIGGEQVFVPIEVKDDKAGRGKVNGVVLDAGKKGLVKKTYAEQTSRLWGYRGGKVPENDDFE